MTDEERIREMVRQVVHRVVGRPSAPRRQDRSLVTGREIQQTEAGAELVVPAGALVTPLARQVAIERKVRLVESGKAAARRSERLAPARATSPDTRTVAIGADHGGYALKETLKGHLRELGYGVLDCGTRGTGSVDYPDFALAVARLVAGGRAWRGILVDGAGIGSCMAANKVPGVRAALCYDEATAVNSRAHNAANVLTLGAGMIDPAAAHRILTTWLETPAGGGRHARRVKKIMEIEARYLRRSWSAGA
ncbi:MAG: ribose 5-phosphate isomerase B [Gemmatimonadota bacterium]